MLTWNAVRALFFFFVLFSSLPTTILQRHHVHQVIDHCNKKNSKHYTDVYKITYRKEKLTKKCRNSENLKRDVVSFSRREKVSLVLVMSAMQFK